MFVIYNCWNYSLDGERGFKHSKTIIGFDPNKEALKARWDSCVASCPAIVTALLQNGDINTSPILGDNDSVVYAKTTGYGNNNTYTVIVEEVLDFMDEGYKGFGSVFAQCSIDTSKADKWLALHAKMVANVKEANHNSCY